MLISGLWVSTLKPKSQSGERLPDRTALVVGAEGFGLSRLVGETCDLLIKIPIKQEGVSSLNASVAAALGIFEWARVRV